MRLIDADKMATDELAAFISAQWKITDETKRNINSIVHEKIQRLIADTPTVETAEPQSDGIQFRTVDDLGRICIPKDIRDKLGIKPGTECAVYSTDESTPEEIIAIRRK